MVWNNSFGTLNRLGKRASWITVPICIQLNWMDPDCLGRDSTHALCANLFNSKYVQVVLLLNFPKSAFQQYVSCAYHWLGWLLDMFCIHPSIHLSSVGSRWLSRVFLTSISSKSSWGIHRHFHSRWDILSLQWVLGLPWGLLPVGHARKPSKGRHPGGILNRCWNHLSWLLSTITSTGFTPSSLGMLELFTPFLH